MVGIGKINASLAIFALFILSAIAAGFLASGEDIWRQIAQLTSIEILILLALSLANYGFRAARWWLYTHAAGAKMRPSQVLRHYIGGFALTMTPARIGELIRLRWIARETGVKFENLAPLILVDRAGDLASTGLLLGLALLLGGAGFPGALPVALLAIIAAIVATRPVLFLAVSRALWRTIGRKPRLFVRLRRAARALTPFSKPSLAFPALGLGAIGWFAEAYAFYLLLSFMGVDLGLWSAVAIFLFAMMTGGATGMPGGIGGAEAAMIALLSLQGVPLEISIPATAIIRITTLWFAVGLGVLVFPFAEGFATRGQHASEIS